MATFDAERLRFHATKPRVFILTDISNEPDDAESLVRYLVYNNELDTEGLVACTSTWMRNKVDPDAIVKIVTAYGEVLSNLNHHIHPDSAFPAASKLLGLVRSGPSVYGCKALEPNVPLSDGAALLIERLEDTLDNRPLWVLCWGGANCLAQALQHIHRTRSNEQATVLRRKLRVYTISDQDDTGYWIRLTWPDIFYICSVHGWNDYTSAAWLGISAKVDEGGPDESKLSREWIKENIQIGPLGSEYPGFKFIVEGDTPTFLYLIQNGLGSPEQPHFGSWGGRYNAIDLSMSGNHYADACESVVGRDGKIYISSKATIWRWRDAYQNDFAARMQWTLTDKPREACHQPVATVNGFSGAEPLVVQVEAGHEVTLDASHSFDPDGGLLSFSWWPYKEPSLATGLVPPQLPDLEIKTSDHNQSGAVVMLRMPPPERCAIDFLSGAPQELGQSFHWILEVRNSGTVPLVSYKRVVLQATNRRLRGRSQPVDTVTEWLNLQHNK